MILDLAAQGKTDKQIAADLDLSVGTIRTYWGRIRVKFSAMTRAQAVGIFVRHRAALSAPPAGSRMSSMSGSLVACMAQEWCTAAWHVDPKTRAVKPLTEGSTVWLKKRSLGPPPPGTSWSAAFGEAVNQFTIDFEERLLLSETVADWLQVKAPEVTGLFVVKAGDVHDGYFVLVVPQGNVNNC